MNSTKKRHSPQCLCLGMLEETRGLLSPNAEWLNSVFSVFWPQFISNNSKYVCHTSPSFQPSSVCSTQQCVIFWRYDHVFIVSIDSFCSLFFINQVGQNIRTEYQLLRWRHVNYTHAPSNNNSIENWVQKCLIKHI